MKGQIEMKGRIEQRFAETQNKGRKAFIPFIMGCDPDYKTSLEILNKLPDAGADIIEIGMPFSDPMADGPTIQEAGLRALKSGATLKKVLQLVKEFRKGNKTTPIILMGYFNPIYNWGAAKFVDAAKAAGVDGLLIVDLPPEEDKELSPYCLKTGIALIKLIAPTSTRNRMQVVTEKASGFLYYVSIAGITGTKTADISGIKKSLTELRKVTDLPVAVGFGIKSAAQVKEVAKFADAVVVGSALVGKIKDNLKNKKRVVEATLKFCRELSKAVK